MLQLMLRHSVHPEPEVRLHAHHVSETKISYMRKPSIKIYIPEAYEYAYNCKIRKIRTNQITILLYLAKLRRRKQIFLLPCDISD